MPYQLPGDYPQIHLIRPEGHENLGPGHDNTHGLYFDAEREVYIIERSLMDIYIARAGVDKEFSGREV